MVSFVFGKTVNFNFLNFLNLFLPKDKPYPLEKLLV